MKILPAAIEKVKFFSLQKDSLMFLQTITSSLL